MQICWRSTGRLVDFPSGSVSHSSDASSLEEFGVYPRKTDCCPIADSVMTWAPYLYTTVRSKHSVGRHSVRRPVLTATLCWAAVAAGRGRTGRRRPRGGGGAASSGAAAVREGHRVVVADGDGGGAGQWQPHGHTGSTTADRILHSEETSLSYSRNAQSTFFQNTNGVNFYNILTQEPDEKVPSRAQDYIGKGRPPRDTSALSWSPLRVSDCFHPASPSGAAPHPTPPQAVAEPADERCRQEEAGHHPAEHHVGRFVQPQSTFAPFPTRVC